MTCTEPPTAARRAQLSLAVPKITSSPHLAPHTCSHTPFPPGSCSPTSTHVQSEASSRSTSNLAVIAVPLELARRQLASDFIYEARSVLRSVYTTRPHSFSPLLRSGGRRFSTFKNSAAGYSSSVWFHHGHFFPVRFSILHRALELGPLSKRRVGWQNAYVPSNICRMPSLAMGGPSCVVFQYLFYPSFWRIRPLLDSCEGYVVASSKHTLSGQTTFFRRLSFLTRSGAYRTTISRQKSSHLNAYIHPCRRSFVPVWTCMPIARTRSHLSSAQIQMHMDAYIHPLCFLCVSPPALWCLQRR